MGDRRDLQGSALACSMVDYLPLHEPPLHEYDMQILAELLFAAKTKVLKTVYLIRNELMTASRTFVVKRDVFCIFPPKVSSGQESIALIYSETEIHNLLSRMPQYAKYIYTLSLKY
jgi:hypothetical protein